MLLYQHFRRLLVECMPDFKEYPLGKDSRGTGKRGVLVGALLLAGVAAAAAILFFSCAEFQLGFHFSWGSAASPDFVEHV